MLKIRSKYIKQRFVQHKLTYTLINQNLKFNYNKIKIICNNNQLNIICFNCVSN